MYSEFHHWTIDDFSVISEICEKKFRSVLKVKYKINDLIYVLKVIHVNKNEKLLKNEVNIHNKLKHQHILKCYGAFIEEQLPDKKYIYMILEYMPEGNIFDYIEKYGQFQEYTIIEIAKQIYSAIEYCHKKGIIHRDIKPENILVESVIDGIPLIKLADFGHAIKKETFNGYAGTIHYRAPEMLKKMCSNKNVDLWSLGVLLYKLATNELPFDYKSQSDDFLIHDTNDLDKLKLLPIEKVDYSLIKSNKIKNIIVNLLMPNPNDRIFIQEEVM